MGLGIALDELLATGWSGLDSTGCAFDVDGRVYPTPARVQQEFAQAGFSLAVQKIDKYNCFRASWREVGQATDAGAVVSHSEPEAAVYALAQFRRGLVAAEV